MTYKLPAGTYYVGDPCYILDSDTYNWFLDYTDYFQDVESMVNYENAFIIFPTYHGDGVYSDQSSMIYSVDSGTLGCIPESLVIQDEGIERKIRDGLVYKCTYEEGFNVEENRGIIEFGSTKIDTNPNDIEDEDWPEDWRDPYEVILDTYEGW